MVMDAAAPVVRAVGGAVPKMPPGFRFHPTDEELILLYLRRRVLGLPLPADIIPDVDLLRFDPWDLLDKSGDERYFFNQREAKYTNGNRSNRATSKGYWKATGKEKQVLAPRGKQLVGMKRVLVFYQGKPPRGSRTDWIMHEYRLAGALAAVGNAAMKKNMATKDDAALAEGWVLCRIFKKRRSARNDGDIEDELNEGENVTAANDAVTYIDLFGKRVPILRRRPFSPDSSCVTDISDELSRDETSSRSLGRAP